MAQFERLSPPEDGEDMPSQLEEDLFEDALNLVQMAGISPEGAAEHVSNDVKYGGPGERKDLERKILKRIRHALGITVLEEQKKAPKKPALRRSRPRAMGGPKPKREYRPEDGYQPEPLE